MIPSAFAVRMFTTSSILLACSIGMYFGGARWKQHHSDAAHARYDFLQQLHNDSIGDLAAALSALTISYYHSDSQFPVSPMASSIYDIPVTTLDGRQTTLADYKGKPMLIVNTASECGFTSQYKGLEELHGSYGERGLTILGFPCNQFGGQEPGSDAEIAAFCERNYGVTFPMFSKIDVNGDATHPLFSFLKKAKPGLLGSEAIKWNFTKFLVDGEGNVVDRYAPKTEPRELAADIEKLL